MLDKFSEGFAVFSLQRQQKIISAKYSFILAIAVATFILSIPSIINGFPFLYYDSTYYLNHIFLGANPGSFLWRPLTYGLFAGYISKLFGVQVFIIIQNFIIAFCLYIFLRFLFKKITPFNYLLLICLLHLTPLPIYSNFILPDVFTGLMIIFSVFAFWGYKRLISVSGLVITIALHYSNLLIAVLSVPFLIATKSLRTAVLIVIGSMLFLSSVHFYTAHNFTISNVTNAILFSRLSHWGISEPLLNEECSKGTPLLLCSHREIPFNIWDRGTDSRIYKLGGLSKLSSDFKYINKKILMSWGGFSNFFSLSIRNIGTQFTAFIDNMLPIYSSDVLEKEMSWSNLHNKAAYKKNHRLQNFFLKFGHSISILHMIIFLISIYYLARCFFLQKKSHPWKTVFLTLCLFYLLNSIVCGSLTDPNPRYNSRFSWMFFLLASSHFLLLREKAFSVLKIKDMPLEKALTFVLYFFILLIILLDAVSSGLITTPSFFYLGIFIGLITIPALPTLHSFTSNKNALIGFLSFTFIGLIIRSIHLFQKSIWYEEYIQFAQALRLFPADAATSQQQMPLSYFFSHIGFSLFGHSETAARIFPLIWGSLACGFFYLLCQRHLKNQWAVVLSSILFMISPPLIFYSQVGRPMSLTLLMGVLYLISWSILLEKKQFNRGDYALLFLSTFFLLNSTFFQNYIFIISINIVLFFIKFYSSNERLKLLGAQALAFLATFPMLYSVISEASLITYFDFPKHTARTFIGRLIEFTPLSKENQ